MGLILKMLIVGLIISICCKLYFDTMAEPRKWKYGWIEKTVLPAFLAGFIVIGTTPIPPYLLQPVRLVIMICLIAQLYYQVRIIQNIILSILFTAFGWIIESLVLAFIFALPEDYWWMNTIEEFISYSILLLLMLFVHYKWKNVLLNRKWKHFAYFPILGLALMVILNTTLWEESIDGSARAVIYTVCSGLFLIAFYFITSIFEKEARMQNLLLMQERVRNQMNLYQDMQKNYEQQRRFLHDYKNQLVCIQNLLTEGEVKKTLEYVTQLTGSIRKSGDYVNTNHPVVNVILNRKYQDAQDKGIVLSIMVNDLSRLKMSEEDIVTMLVNLFDNAIEACDKLNGNRIIKLKMVLEEQQLIFSIGNPVEKPIAINGKLISTSKNEKHKHGIGLMNVDSVIRKNKGTSTLKCDHGWFYFSAIIPNEHTTKKDV